jgi:threonine dehydratase
MPLPQQIAPTIDDIRAAAEHIAPYATQTPLLESPHLNAIVGGRLLIKAEPLQRTGSFKFRGAFNTINQITEIERENGIIAYSSGNHAQGVAAAAEILGIDAVIVMPSDAPQIKIRNTRGYGAEVITYDRHKDDREAVAREISAARNLTMIRPYDDPRIIAGQATVALEAMAQLIGRDEKPDAVLCPCGGGGLVSGVAIAAKAAFPDVEVYAVEPAFFDDTARSLRQGMRVENDPAAQSFCDALLAPSPGELTFSIMQTHISSGLTVTDEQTSEAMRQAFSRGPGGCLVRCHRLQKPNHGHRLLRR